MPQDVSPGFSYAESRTVRLGDRNSPGLHPGTFSAVPSGLVVLERLPRTNVLGYFQPSLRDSNSDGETALSIKSFSAASKAPGAFRTAGAKSPFFLAWCGPTKEAAEKVDLRVAHSSFA